MRIISRSSDRPKGLTQTHPRNPRYPRYEHEFTVRMSPKSRRVSDRQMTFAIRPALASDAPAIGSLANQFASYLRSLGDPTGFKLTAEAYLRDGFGLRPAFQGLVAEKHIDFHRATFRPAQIPSVLPTLVGNHSVETPCGANSTGILKYEQASRRVLDRRAHLLPA